MNRTIEIRKDTSYGVATMLPGLAPAALWDCEVDLTLLLIGFLTSPPKFRGLSLSHYWAWLRYGIAIHPRGDLRLRSIWQEIDSHQKTVLSDDFGAGFPCHYLVANHGFEDFADTGYLIKHLLKGFVSLLKNNKLGPSKSPDFIAVDNLGRLHVIECKGTQSSRAKLAEAIARGIPQKNNLSNPGLFASCMVGGIFVPQRKSKEAAEIVFADPPVSELLKRLAELGQTHVGQGVRRISLAKSLSMAGLWTAASAISDERVARANVNFIRNLAKGELGFAGYVKDGDTGNWERTVSFRSLEENPDIPNAMIPVVTTLTILVPPSVESLFARAVNENGSVNRAEVDVWIAEQLSLNRVKRFAAEGRFEKRGANGEEQPVRLRRRLLLSSWSKVGSHGLPFEQSKARGWRTGSGIQFLIERRSVTGEAAPLA